MKYTIWKSFFVASSLSFLAVACAAGGATSESSDQEEVSTTSSALNPEDGRITGPADPAKRCAGPGIPDDVCETKRLKARDKGCVTEGEYQALKRYGSFATCDYDVAPASLEGWCPCGCFDQSVQILARHEGDDVEWHSAGDITRDFHNFKLEALSPETTISAPAFLETDIRIATIGPEEDALYVIGTQFGKGLKLTSEHAVLLHEGKMVTTRSLQVGQVLAGVNGEPVVIESIERVHADKDVVNFATEADSHISHILAAEGVLVGDLLWQASYSDQMNAVIIRQ